MKVVVLDGYTLNPGDLNWTDLERLAHCDIYPRTKPEEIIERAKDAEVILTNKVQLNDEILAQLPLLEHIIVLATGINNIDLATCQNRNISVSNAADYSSHAVCQLVFALMIELQNKVSAHHHAITKGWWHKTGDFSFSLGTWRELHGKTLGLLGFGNIAKEVATVAQAFGMKVLVHRRNMNADKPEGINYVSLKELAQKSDVISLHAPATPKTNLIVNKEFLESMQAHAFLINTARGILVNENDLAASLNDGIIAGAALDVLQQEPPETNHPLLSAKNCIITPHIAWSSLEARKRLMEITVQNLRSFMMGEPENKVI